LPIPPPPQGFLYGLNLSGVRASLAALVRRVLRASCCHFTFCEKAPKGVSLTIETLLFGKSHPTIRRAISSTIQKLSFQIVIKWQHCFPTLVKKITSRRARGYFLSAENPDRRRPAQCKDRKGF